MAVGRLDCRQYYVDPVDYHSDCCAPLDFLVDQVAMPGLKDVVIDLFARCHARIDCPDLNFVSLAASRPMIDQLVGLTERLEFFDRSIGLVGELMLVFDQIGSKMKAFDQTGQTRTVSDQTDFQT